MSMTFEEWYAANREIISEFSRDKYLPSIEKKQKAVAEIVWNLTRPGVTYTIDKTTEIKRITLDGGLQPGDCHVIMARKEIPNED